MLKQFDMRTWRENTSETTRRADSEVVECYFYNKIQKLKQYVSTMKVDG